jgi:hypothetical protein
MTVPKVEGDYSIIPFHFFANFHFQWLTPTTSGRFQNQRRRANRGGKRNPPPGEHERYPGGFIKPASNPAVSANKGSRERPTRMTSA